jgi:hypothetical protein
MSVSPVDMKGKIVVNVLVSCADFAFLVPKALILSFWPCVDGGISGARR